MMNQSIPLAHLNHQSQQGMGALMGNSSFRGGGAGVDPNAAANANQLSAQLFTALMNQSKAAAGMSSIPATLSGASANFMGLSGLKAYQQLLGYPGDALTAPTLPTANAFPLNGMDQLQSTYLLQRQLMMGCNPNSHLLATPQSFTSFPPASAGGVAAMSLAEKTRLQQLSPLNGKRDTSQQRKRGGVLEPFPEKLHRMLREAEAAGRSDVISFVSGGRAFAIHKPNVFFNEIVPYYFRQSRLSSFKRQLNLYGFELINSGPSRGGYFHEMFRKDMPELCLRMRRTVNQQQKTKSSDKTTSSKTEHHDDDNDEKEESHLEESEDV